MKELRLLSDITIESEGLKTRTQKLLEQRDNYELEIDNLKNKYKKGYESANLETLMLFDNEEELQ